MTGVTRMNCRSLGRTLLMLLGLGLLWKVSAEIKSNGEPYSIKLKSSGCISGDIKSVDVITCPNLASPLLYVMSYDEFGNNKAQVCSFSNKTGTQYSHCELLREPNNHAGIGHTVSIYRNNICYLSATFNTYCSNCHLQPAQYPSYIPTNFSRNYPYLNSCGLSVAFVLKILTAELGTPPTYEIQQLNKPDKFQGLTTIELTTENNLKGDIYCFVWIQVICGCGCAEVGISCFPPSKSLEEASVRPFQSIPVSSNSDVTSLKTKHAAYLLIAQQNQPKCGRYSSSFGCSSEKDTCGYDKNDEPSNVLDIWEQKPGQLFYFKQRMYLQNIQSTSAFTTQNGQGCFVIVASSKNHSSGSCESLEDYQGNTAVYIFCYDDVKNEFTLLKTLQISDVIQASIQKCGPDGDTLLYVLTSGSLRIYQFKDSSLHFVYQLPLNCGMKRMDFASFSYRDKPYNQIILTCKCGGAKVYNINCGPKNNNVANWEPQNGELVAEQRAEFNYTLNITKPPKVQH